jgi:WD40 repeat protein
MRLRHLLLLSLASSAVATLQVISGEPSADTGIPQHSADARDALPAGAVLRLGDVRFWWKNCYIGSLIFSPDSETLAVAAARYQFEPIEEPAVRLLEIPSGAEGRLLKKLPLSMTTVAFSPDGKSLAGIHSLDSGFSLGLSVWELAEGTRRYSSDAGNQQSPALAYAPDGRCLATTAYKTVLLRDAATGRELRRLEGHATEVVALAFSPDGKLLASSSSPTDAHGKTEGSTLRLWDVAGGKLLREIAYDRKSPFQVLHFSSDGKILAAWKPYAGVSLHEVATGREIRTIRGKFATVAFSADGKLLVTGGPTIHLWELPAGQQLRSFPGCVEMRLLTLSPDSKTLAAVVGDGHGGRIRLWDVTRGEEIVSYPGHRGAVQSLSCTADGRTLFSAGSDGTVRVWDLAWGKQQRVLADREADFRSVAVSPDGQTIAARDGAGNVTFWSSTAKKLGHFALKEPSSFFRHWSGLKPLLAFSDNGHIPISGRKLWEGSLAKAPRTLRTDKDDSIPVDLSPDGTLFASIAGPSGSMGGSDTWIIRVRRLESGDEICRIKGEKDEAFWAAAFSPDGKILATSRSKRDDFHGRLYQHQLIFWEVASGKQFLQINLRYRTHALAFSPDGKFLATACGLYYWPEYDRTIRIWDVTTGKLLEGLSGHGGLVNALLFSPDGRRLFSGSDDGTILVWDTRWPHPRPRRMREDLTAKQLHSAWADLAGADGALAFRSLSDLASVPRRAVPFLREQLSAPTTLDRQGLARLIADLDSDDFTVRERARTALQQQGEFAEEALQKTLQNRPSLEVRRQIEALLERARAEQLRMSRAMLALEWMDAPQARQLIETLARGTPEARLTREAKAAWHRLSRRSPVKP